MNPRTRKTLFLVGAAIVGALLLWGYAGLPDFGNYQGAYGFELNRVAVKERKATNVVASTTFDYRGFDTLGEEFILFAAVLATTLLLRLQREESEQVPVDHAPHREVPHDSDLVRETGAALIAPAVLFGLYVVIHGHLTPGGGFQGGVVLATAPMLMYLVGEYVAFRRLAPEGLIEGAEGTGGGAYTMCGLIGILAGAQFMSNVLPLGRPAQLPSAGLIPPQNLVVALAVSAGFVLLLSEFLEQTLTVRRRR
jgi:multicomponent Na+:H+ antiporter subunit B